MRHAWESAFLLQQSSYYLLIDFYDKVEFIGKIGSHMDIFPRQTRAYNNDEQ